MRNESQGQRTRASQVGWLAILAALVLATVGCGNVAEAVDAAVEQVDANPSIDAGPTIDAAPPSKPTTQFQTAAGGKATSANYVLQIRVGAPQPMGSAVSTNFKARLGPSAE